LKKIIICIVAYDAESTIRNVLDRIPREVKEKVAEFVVFDDESRDGTVRVAEAWRSENPQYSNFHVYRNPHNLGYGGNQKRCYRYCIEKGYDVVVLLHGDGQYAPEVLPELLAPLEQDDADAVFGSRMMVKGAALKGGMPLYKYVGNKILTFFENRMLGMDLSEFHSGYRLYSVQALARVPFEKNTNDFHFDTEIIVQFRAKGLRIKELAIPTYYGDEICHVNGLKYAFDVARSVIQYKLHENGVRNYPKYEIGRRPEPVYSFKKDRHSSHGQVIAMTPSKGLAILDLGCGPGELARQLKKEGNRVVGIDRRKPEGEPPCEIIQRDIEDGIDLPVGREFDRVLFLDVLEHLKEPDRALREARRYMKEGGRLVVSLPNVAHWSVRFSLLFGRFHYGQKGILDKTHLHFYTLSTARQLLREANYRVLETRTTPLPLIDTFPAFRSPFLRWIHWIDVVLSRVLRGLFAYQFIFTAEDTFDADYDRGNKSISAADALQ